MRVASVTFGLVTVAALDMVLLLGATGEPPWFGTLVMVMDITLIVSSILLGVVFLRDGKTVLASLFLSNLGLMLAAMLIRAYGLRLTPMVLFGADVYWLNLYISGLVVCIRTSPRGKLTGVADYEGR